MRAVFYVLTTLAIMLLAVWAYNENHKTQQSRAEVNELRREIRGLREAISVQRAEWAYLNRPERLRELAEMNFMRLQLMPMTGAQYGSIGEIVYPLPETPEVIEAPLGNAIEVLGEIRHTAGEGRP